MANPVGVTLSLVPRDRLPPVNAIDYPVFVVSVEVSARTWTYDTWAKWWGFWRSVVIRNFDTQRVLWYRRDPGGLWSRVPPAAERTVEGWGSLLEIRSGDPNVNTIAEVEFEIARLDQVDTGAPTPAEGEA